MSGGDSMTMPAPGGRQPVLITGGAGFIGSNLAHRLAQEGHNVLIYDALSRPGVEANVGWLRDRHPKRVSLCHADIRDTAALEYATRDAQAVFHLAAQVAVTTSLVNPVEDFDINLRGTFTLLDALRRRGGKVPLIFASTNKVYGDLLDIPLKRDRDAYVPVDPAVRANGISESYPLDFHTPYGCSKGAADQYVLDFARSFGVPSAVLRMSCIYGQRQMGTEDQGWVAHFLIRALRGEPISIFGDGYQVRDLLQVDDAVEAYMAAWQRIGAVQGRAFNLGGGPGNAVSLREVLAAIGDLVGHQVEIQYADWRAGDQKYFVTDTRLVTRELGLREPLPWRAGIARLASWLRHQHGFQSKAATPALLP
jgi:CDP-paratose 2-epimerase